MALGRLAGHVSDMTGDWALQTLTKDKLEFPADTSGSNMCREQGRAAGEV